MNMLRSWLAIASDIAAAYRGELAEAARSRAYATLAVLNSAERTDPVMFGLSGAMLAWHSSGFPQVCLGARLAASFMCTSIGSADDVHMPWPAMVVRIPSGILSATNLNGKRVSLDWIIMSLSDDRLFMRVASEDGGMIFGHPASSIKDLVRDGLAWDALVDSIPTKTETETWRYNNSADQRAVQLAGRLALCALLELSSGEFASRIETGPHHGPRRNGQEPKAWTFELRREVKLDLREQVRSYLGGHGPSPKVQVLVRGHWKRQPCGVARADRRMIHVEPYWRGPETAPIAVTPRRLDLS